LSLELSENPVLAGPERWKASAQPYYKAIPKDVTANLLFRKAIVDLGNSSAEHAESIRNMCAADPLFYINAFVWTYDPRRTPSKLPMVTYEYQDEGIMALLESIKVGQDALIEKSRDMGASWMILIAFEYLWHFWPDQSFLMVSRKESLVDEKGDPDSLFWKIDFIHNHLPTWLLPPTSRKLLSIVNDSNGSTIDGDSTTGDIRFAAVVARRSVWTSSRRSRTDTRRWRRRAMRRIAACSIRRRRDMGNAFADLAHSKIKKLVFHWTLHPRKAEGKYLDDNGKWRSPWYDRECERRSHPMEIAQELDIDYLGSDYQFFDPIMVSEVQRLPNAAPDAPMRDQVRRGDWRFSGFFRRGH